MELHVSPSWISRLRKNVYPSNSSTKRFACLDNAKAGPLKFQLCDPVVRPEVQSGFRDCTAFADLTHTPSGFFQNYGRESGWKSHTGERTRASAAVQGDRPTGPAAGHWTLERTAGLLLSGVDPNRQELGSRNAASVVSRS